MLLSNTTILSGNNYISKHLSLKSSWIKYEQQIIKSAFSLIKALFQEFYPNVIIFIVRKLSLATGLEFSLTDSAIFLYGAKINFFFNVNVNMF